MNLKSIKTWAWLHKWSSLISTLFLLMLCITGVPLIFSHEINSLLGNDVAAPAMPAHTPHASMDAMLAKVQNQYPQHMVQFMYQEADEPDVWGFTLGQSIRSDENLKFIFVDARTTQILAEPKFNEGFLHIMFRLHVDMFAGLPGMLFLGLMGVLFVIALVSGVVLYAPFMRRLAFGEIRQQRSVKLKRLDTHNLLGVVSLVWMLVVGITGIINAWSDLVIDYWQSDQIAAMTAPYKGLPPPSSFASLQASVAAALKQEPQMRIKFIAFPGTSFSSPHHYGIFMHGDSPLTSRLTKPVLIDAETSRMTDSRNPPWYITALQISQPLHFGDYGGMPLKLLWLLLDLITIVVLWTGLMLWWRKHRADKCALTEHKLSATAVKTVVP
jgi:uncharacterized iron-regulated membrane protein